MLKKNREINSPDQLPESRSSGASGWWRPVVLIFGIFVMLFLAKWFGLGERIGLLREWIQSFGAWSGLIFSGLYILATITAIPGTALTLSAGAIFGSLPGVIIVSFSSTVGAAICFLIARYFARNAMIGWLGENQKFQKLDRLTEQQGAMIVAITRIVPIFPFNLLNYGFGLTRVPFLTYVFWSWLCMLPGTILYVVGADVFTSSIANGKVPKLLIIVLVGTSLALIGLVHIAKKKLQDKEGDAHVNQTTH